MAALPTGTVTFLFTDIDGSTTLRQRIGDRRYAEVLAEHQRLLRDVFAKGNGREIDTQGDAFLVAFAGARDAVAAAVAAQKSLMEHRWPDGASLRVRMGLHTGEPISITDRYVGLDVHRAARIGAARRSTGVKEKISRNVIFRAFRRSALARQDSSKTTNGGVVVDQVCAVFSVMPGKSDAARDFMRQLDGARRVEFDRSERRIGITKEVWFLAQGPAGDQLVGYMESKNFQDALGMFSQSQDAFDQWFKRCFAEVTGVDFNNLPPGLKLPEVLSSYQA